MERTKEAMNNWISVKDKLPSDGGWYLVAYASNSGFVTIASYDEQKGEFYHKNGSIFLTVSHWQPLPKPPTK